MEDKGALAPEEVYALERAEVLEEPEATKPGTGGYDGGLGNPAGSGYWPWIGNFGGRAKEGGGVTGVRGGYASMGCSAGVEVGTTGEEFKVGSGGFGGEGDIEGYATGTD